MATAVLPFLLDDARFAVPLARVLEVVPRVTVTPIAGAPSWVPGAFAHRGELRAVIDLRARLALPPRAPSIDDHFVIARAARRTVALVVDRALPPTTLDDGALDGTLRTADVRGAVTTAEGVVLLHDLDAVLSLADDALLDAGLSLAAEGA